MNIKQIKERFTCFDVAELKAKKSGQGFVAHCPWRPDRRPSLTISADGRGWHDFATGEHGSVVDFAAKMLNTNDFTKICAFFEKLDGTLLIKSQQSIATAKNVDEGKEKINPFKFFQIVDLQSVALFNYLKDRGIEVRLCKEFLKEAHYSFNADNQRFMFALAFVNNSGGYELRSTYFKGCYGLKDVTTIEANPGKPWIVFEGFFDFLSFVTLDGEIKRNYLILNSIVNVNKAISILRDIRSKVYLCLDNDDHGHAAACQIMKNITNSIDLSNRYQTYKDINEMLISVKSK